MRDRKRNELDITADIIRVAQGGALKTRIVYKANLNFKIVKRYLRELMEKGFITFSEPHYFTTDKGESYLTRYEALKNL